MILLTATIGARTFRLGRAVDLAIPLDFHGPQPNAFGVPAASAKPYSEADFTLDTREGGACNCEAILFVPHCNGTHTESSGHLTHERFPISLVMPPPLLAATLVSIQPQGREITAASIGELKIDPDFSEAWIVRTLPNAVEKASRQWTNDTTPYFTIEAMAAIRARGIQHLLIDLPSVDPLRDEGRLAAHRIFWGLPPGSQELPEQDARPRTITEMIFVPDDVPDGQYLLSIQLPRFVSDAVPSRPLLFYLDEAS